MYLMGVNEGMSTKTLYVNELSLRIQEYMRRGELEISINPTIQGDVEIAGSAAYTRGFEDEKDLKYKLVTTKTDPRALIKQGDILGPNLEMLTGNLTRPIAQNIHEEFAERGYVTVQTFGILALYRDTKKCFLT